MGSLLIVDVDNNQSWKVGLYGMDKIAVLELLAAPVICPNMLRYI